jgi:hypothetical protein
LVIMSWLNCVHQNDLATLFACSWRSPLLKGDNEVKCNAKQIQLIFWRANNTFNTKHSRTLWGEGIVKPPCTCMICKLWRLSDNLWSAKCICYPWFL